MMWAEGQAHNARPHANCMLCVEQREVPSADAERVALYGGAAPPWADVDLVHPEKSIK